jgi:hypothetical protein
MFEVLQGLERMRSGVFIQRIERVKTQESREFRQRRTRKEKQKEFETSVDAIKCEYAFQNVCKKWGWKWLIS